MTLDWTFLDSLTASFGPLGDWQLTIQQRLDALATRVGTGVHILNTDAYLSLMRG